MEMFIETEKDMPDGSKERRRYDIVPKKGGLFNRESKEVLTITSIDERVFKEDGQWDQHKDPEISLGRAPQEIQRVSIRHKEKEVEFWLLGGTSFLLQNLSQITATIVP